MSGVPKGVPCLLMRGGTSKGAYFLASDLPAEPDLRDDLLLRIMGSPDERQIDGLGGAHPLTSKVAVVSPSADPDADIDYLFLQVAFAGPEVSDRQNCGNILAGIGPFAVERGLVPAGPDETSVRIRMVNSGDRATATFPTPGGRVDYTGDAEISGVPGAAAPVLIEFPPGPNPLLPTGSVREEIDGVRVTCVDNGMPTVLIAATSLDVTGYESPAALEEDPVLADRLRRIRLEAGRRMGLGNVADATVPKLTLLAPPREGGAVTTRTFIPVRCHPSIGVLGAAGVAAGLRIEGSAGADLADLEPGSDRIRIEHPTGFLDIESSLVPTPEGLPSACRTAVVRTARKIFDGTVFPRSAETAPIHPHPLGGQR
ncbi:4-oxalomesaconate tautomerase [Streptomyces phaeoluteigriseus]|uniref:4-oxalomesaconate tautomerase n=1 Tax=Streptomyces phaeoluteigriseus TaxID=114686 RepID=A0ABY4Z6F0_9ACTN|nr:4-oxalomesaconate tautomerase [Streptomyces phaeoluteigriseus]USQ84629.1 4-oxalomesaconate tautomerase [Streptomyces phaeoluteigriseus]